MISGTVTESRYSSHFSDVLVIAQDLGMCKQGTIHLLRYLVAQQPFHSNSSPSRPTSIEPLLAVAASPSRISICEMTRDESVRAAGGEYVGNVEASGGGRASGGNECDRVCQLGPRWRALDSEDQKQCLLQSDGVWCARVLQEAPGG